MAIRPCRSSTIATSIPPCCTHRKSYYRVALLVPLCGSAGLWSPSCIACAQVAVEETQSRRRHRWPPGPAADDRLGTRSADAGGRDRQRPDRNRRNRRHRRHAHQCCPAAPEQNRAAAHSLYLHTAIRGRRTDPRDFCDRRNAVSPTGTGNRLSPRHLFGAQMGADRQRLCLATGVPFIRQAEAWRAGSVAGL